MPQRIILIMESSKNLETVRLSLFSGRTMIAEDRIRIDSPSPQLLESIMDLCTRAEITLTQLTAIVIVFGKTRFTISRLMAVVGNTIAWSMRIPIASFATLPSFDEIEKRAEESPIDLISAQYAKEPNITFPHDHAF